MFLICFCLFLLFFLGGFYDSSRGWRPGKEITPEMIRAVHMSPPPGSLELRVVMDGMRRIELASRLVQLVQL